MAIIAQEAQKHLRLQKQSLQRVDSECLHRLTLTFRRGETPKTIHSSIQAMPPVPLATHPSIYPAIHPSLHQSVNFNPAIHPSAHWPNLPGLGHPSIHPPRIPPSINFKNYAPIKQSLLRSGVNLAPLQRCHCHLVGSSRRRALAGGPHCNGSSRRWR